MSAHPALRRSVVVVVVVVCRIPAEGLPSFRAYEAAVLAVAPLERRLVSADGTTEVHVLRFADVGAYEAFLDHPDRARWRPLLEASGATVEALVGFDDAGSFVGSTAARPELVLRDTAPTDLVEILELEAAPHAAPFVEAWTRSHHQAAMSDDGQRHLIVTIDDRERLGFVVLAALKSDARSIELRRIVMRHVGSGRRALRAVLDRAFYADGAHRVWLKVRVGNVRARKAYAAMGFVHEGLLRDAVHGANGHESLLVMSILEDEWRDR